MIAFDIVMKKSADRNTIITRPVRLTKELWDLIDRDAALGERSGNAHVRAIIKEHYRALGDLDEALMQPQLHVTDAAASTGNFDGKKPKRASRINQTIRSAQEDAKRRLIKKREEEGRSKEKT